MVDGMRLHFDEQLELLNKEIINMGTLVEQAIGMAIEALIRQDVRTGHSYVCEEDGRVVGTFYFYQGKEAEPGYAAIEDGAWIGGDEYGVVHRVAGDGSVKGIGTFCLNWAYGQCGHLRIDTHPDNRVMQSLLEKLGFQKCGVVHVPEDSDPRYAYEKLEG